MRYLKIIFGKINLLPIIISSSAELNRNLRTDVLTGNNIQNDIRFVSVGDIGWNVFGSSSLGHFQLGGHTSPTFSFPLVTFLDILLHILVNFYIPDYGGFLRV